MPAIHFTEVRSFMEWDEVQFERSAWHVPASKMKMERDHGAPLPPRAIEILSAMERFRVPGSPWVFPGSTPGKPMSENTLCQAIQDMGFEATAHGFRSTFTDWARAVPHADRLIKFQLALVDKNKTREAYGRDGQLALRREMMSHWADALSGRVPMPSHEGEAMAA